jgi:hypothetical protein
VCVVESWPQGELAERFAQKKTKNIPLFFSKSEAGSKTYAEHPVLDLVVGA